jgi:acylphosphatase
MIGVSIIVDGIVQGVGFRWFTVGLAEKYGVKGWVKNRVRGDVEIYAEGEKEIIDRFIEALRKGPRYGRVDALDIELREYKGGFSDFRIKG